MNIKSFTPRPASSVNISVSASTQRVLVCADNGDVDIRVMNNGTTTAWITFGTVTIEAAVATGVPIGPGVTEVLRAPNQTGALYIAAIAAGATGTIYFTPGSGL